MFPVTGTFWQATQPVSLASVPSHAVTNAGTFAVQVDNTVTVASHAVTNAGTFAVQAAQSGTWNVGTVTTVTNVVHIDDNAGSITIDYATTGSGNATGALRVELPTNGTGVIATVGAVTAITNALPAGSNAIGKLAANSGVDIGDVDITSIAAGDNNIGNVDIVTVPTDPFGVNADAASATGSISAKLRFIAGTGIPITGTVAVTQSGTWDEIGINDSGNSITIDAPVGTPAFVRLSDGSAAITTLPVSLASVPSHAVTNAGVFVVQATLDAETTKVIGTVRVASGGIASGAVASGAIASGAVASGAFASGALASGSIAAGAIADMIIDDAAFTPATSRVLMAGFEADETSTDSVDEGDAGAARMTLDRKQIVTDQPHSAGGCSILKNIDVDETEDDVKTSAGNLYQLFLFNATNAIIYVKLFNATAANVTVGTTVPVLTIPVPGNNDTDGAGVVLNWPKGLFFDTAISIAATTGVADNDTGAPATNAIIAAGAYK